MRLNLAMLDWGVHRLLKGQSPDIRSVATRTWELCPEEVAVAPPAIYPGGNLDRVRSLAPQRDWDTERTLIDGGSCVHAASRAHLVENASISGAFLYRGAAKLQPGYGKETLFPASSEPQRRLDEAVLVSNNTGSHYFGNFLLDELPLGLIAEPGAPTIVAPTRDYEHETGYRALVALPRPPVVRHAKVRRLTLYTDFAQNAYKGERYRELRARLRRALAGSEPPSVPGIYLKRGATGERRVLANEEALERLLGDLGFDIVEPARLGAEDIARRTLEARIVIGVEGSHLSHAIFSMAEDGAFLVLQPPDRFAMPYKEFADRLGHRFGFVVCDPAHDGFMVNLDDVLRIIDRLS